MAFADIQEDLRELNCELMGLSIDSVYAHIAWVRNIEEKLGKKITFPVIADLNKEVATKYGMIMPGDSKTETSRCVFVIDEKQIIRAMIYYPLTTGRNMAEILRLVRCPADYWSQQSQNGLPENLNKIRSIHFHFPKCINAAVPADVQLYFIPFVER